MRNLFAKSSWNKNIIINIKYQIKSFTSLIPKTNYFANNFLLNLKKFNFCALNNHKNKVNLKLNDELQKEFIDQGSSNDDKGSLYTNKAAEHDSIQIYRIKAANKSKFKILICCFAFNSLIRKYVFLNDLDIKKHLIAHKSESKQAEVKEDRNIILLRTESNCVEKNDINGKTENAGNSLVEITEANSEREVLSRKSNRVNKSLKAQKAINSSSESKEIAEADNSPMLLSDNLFSFAYKNNTSYTNSIVIIKNKFEFLLINEQFIFSTQKKTKLFILQKKFYFYNSYVWKLVVIKNISIKI